MSSTPSEQEQRPIDPKTADLEQDLSGKIALITGANSGIGYATTKQLAEKGCLVVMCCRSLVKADDARSHIMKDLGLKDHKRLRIVQLDLGDLDNVQSFPARYGYEMTDLIHRPIDIMILNAGVMALAQRELTKQGIEAQLGINLIGHYMLLAVMYDKIKMAEHGRVVITGSQFHKFANGKIDFDDLNRDKSYWKWVVYGETKLAGLLWMAKLNRLLEEKQQDNVLVVSGHPGYAATNIHRHNWLAKIFSPIVAQSPEQSAKSIVFAATDKNAKRNGYAGPKYLFHLYGDPEWGSDTLPKVIFDVEMQDRVWERCEQWTHANLAGKL
jgi:NAD(P)-dependent dehydrogenase (short-subunit alcohol dehydrogenase family)